MKSLKTLVKKAVSYYNLNAEVTANNLNNNKTLIVIAATVPFAIGLWMNSKISKGLDKRGYHRAAFTFRCLNKYGIATQPVFLLATLTAANRNIATSEVENKTTTS